MTAQVEEIAAAIIALDAQIPRLSVQPTHVGAHVVRNLGPELALVTRPREPCYRTMYFVIKKFSC